MSKLIETYQPLFDINLSTVKSLEVANELVYKLKKYDWLLKSIKYMISNYNLTIHNGFNETVSAISFRDNDNETVFNELTQFITKNSLHKNLLVTFRQTDNDVCYTVINIKGAIKYNR